MSDLIRLDAVSRRFTLGGSEVAALDRVSLRVAEGEYLAVMGPSGSGKSTLLNVLGLLDRPDEGRYWLGGEDTATLSEPALAQLRGHRIGFVFQSFHLISRLTARENVELPLMLCGIAPAERHRRSQRLLGDLGLENRAGHRPAELSGGQRQRVAIARALVCKPRLMLLDEPFSNIDTQVRMKLILEIRALLKQQGIGAIFVSHSKEEAFAFADRLALFRAGHIEQVGQPEQLYRRPQNRFVAEFLGGVNYLAAEVVDSYCVQTALGVICGSEPHGRAVGEQLQLMLRPQQLLVESAADGELKVVEQQFLGHHCRVLFGCGDLQLEASIGEPLDGMRARIKVAPHGLVLFDPLP